MSHIEIGSFKNESEVWKWLVWQQKHSVSQSNAVSKNLLSTLNYIQIIFRKSVSLQCTLMFISLNGNLILDNQEVLKLLLLFNFKKTLNNFLRLNQPFYSKCLNSSWINIQELFAIFSRLNCAKIQLEFQQRY